MSIKRFGRRSIPVVLVLAFGLVLGGITPASGDTVGSTGALANAGVLRLRLGAQDHFQYEPDGGSASTQSISASGACGLSLGSPSLVTLTPSSGSVGFVGDAIGVKAGEGNGQSCGRIDNSQKLTMDLGTAAALDGTLIDFAEIDVELKFGATLVVKGFIVDEFGDAIEVTQSTPNHYSSTGNDSGPDSGDGDNYRIRFPKDGSKTAVNRLEFSLLNSIGGASLEGGSDGTQPCDGTDGCVEPSLGQTLGTTDSLFHLVQSDGILGCGQEADPDGDGIDRPRNVLVRLDNATGDPAECVPIPYDLDSTVDETHQFTTLLKNLFGEDAQFEWTVTWTPEAGTYMEEETQFDFDGDEIFSDIQLCLADGPDPGVFPDLPLSQEEGDPPGTIDPWCVKQTTTTLQVGGEFNGMVVVEETYYGRGDPTGRR